MYSNTFHKKKHFRPSSLLNWLLFLTVNKYEMSAVFSTWRGFMNECKVCHLILQPVYYLYHSNCVPVITVSKLHVHAVAAQEGLAVERRVDVWGMRDGLAHHDHTGERRLFETAQHARRTAGTHLQMARAVQHLKEQPGPSWVTSRVWFQISSAHEREVIHLPAGWL